MSDNAVANAGSGGPNLRLLETAAGVKWPACVASYAVTVSPGANVLQEVTAATPLPVTDAGTGGVADAAATAGSTGSVNAKLRLLTTQIATLLTQTDGLEGFTDGIETLLSAIGTLLAGGLPAALSSGGGVKAGITDVPSDPFGVNADAIVAAGAAGSLSAKLRRVTQGLEDLKTGIVVATGTNSIGATKDNGAQWTSVHGVVGVPFTSADQHSAVASVTDAPTSGQKLVITDLFFGTDTAMNVTFKCETTGAVISGPFYVPANFSGQLTPRSKAWKLATADKKLQVITSVAGNIMVDAHYYSEA